MGNSGQYSPMKTSNFSNVELESALDIIRQNGGKIPFDSISKILLLLLSLYVLSFVTYFYCTVFNVGCCSENRIFNEERIV